MSAQSNASMRKRFYTYVNVTPLDGGFGVALDGRAVYTPARALLKSSYELLVRAVADEWDAQGDFIDLGAMPLTKLINTTLDHVAPQREDVVSDLLQYIDTDLLCYRAESPDTLVERQSMVWQPVLTWLEATHSIKLKTVSGLIPISQSPESKERMRFVLTALNDINLTGVKATAALTSSLSLALALIEGKLTAHETFAAAQMDETWQLEQWGEDSETEKRRAGLEADLMAVDHFVSLCS